MNNLSPEILPTIQVQESQVTDKPILLYVDDEADNLLVFKSTFRRYYKVLTALTGEEALEIAKQEDVALVITDQRMPGMSGVELLKRLPQRPELIRMILTGYSDMEAVVTAINTGMVYRYITKPWNRDELKINLDNALEAHNLRKSNKELMEDLREANSDLEEKVKARTEQVNHQKCEIEKLLLNILPKNTADELQEKGFATPQHYSSATVLFTDFIDFTKIAEGLSPQELVSQLNHCFSAFDEITEKHGLEKIKTIGDAYMCAGGLPASNTTHPSDAVRAGLEIQDWISKINEDRLSMGNTPWQVRVGIHTGPVVAGVVGTKKFAYDIWGDAVNLASRMESCGTAGKVNISQSTYELVKDQFTCEYRGKISAKNKGEVDMYYVG